MLSYLVSDTSFYPCTNKQEKHPILIPGEKESG